MSSVYAVRHLANRVWSVAWVGRGGICATMSAFAQVWARKRAFSSKFANGAQRRHTCAGCAEDGQASGCGRTTGRRGSGGVTTGRGEHRTPKIHRDAGVIKVGVGKVRLFVEFSKVDHCANLDHVVGVRQDLDGQRDWGGGGSHALVRRTRRVFVYAIVIFFVYAVLNGLPGGEEGAGHAGWSARLARARTQGGPANAAGAQARCLPHAY
jgi:hypothetical protein